MWRGGCIIRSAFLGNIRDAFEANPELAFLGLDNYFKDILEGCLPAWRKVVAKSFETGLPMPCMSSALTFLNGYTTAACQQICFRHSVTTLVPTLTSALTSHVVSSTTPTGRVPVVIFLQQPMMFN